MLVNTENPGCCGCGCEENENGIVFQMDHLISLDGALSLDVRDVKFPYSYYSLVNGMLSLYESWLPTNYDVIIIKSENLILVEEKKSGIFEVSVAMTQDNTATVADGYMQFDYIIDLTNLTITEPIANFLDARYGVNNWCVDMSCALDILTSLEEDRDQDYQSTGSLIIPENGLFESNIIMGNGSIMTVKFIDGVYSGYELSSDSPLLKIKMMNASNDFFYKEISGPDLPSLTIMPKMQDVIEISPKSDHNYYNAILIRN